MNVPFRLLAASAALALSACASEAPERKAPEPDPAVAYALMLPLLADPDLTSVSQRFAVFADPTPLDAAIPIDDYAEATVAAARREASGMIGPAAAPALPASGACPGCDALFVDQRARVVAGSCAERLDADLEWSLRLPAELPVYPKAHLREAAGSDDPTCRVRAASFTAPVPAPEVLALYRTLATRGGYALAPAGPAAFTGRKGASLIAVMVRPGPGGYGIFDLVAVSR